MIVRLHRFADTPFGMFGTLYLPELRLYTVERPWRNNRPGISCIPAGRYELVPGRYHRGGYDCWEVRHVPGRTLIKIHIANRARELLGCVAPGLSLGTVRGEWAVQSSTAAFTEFMTMTKDFYDRGETLSLVITDPCERSFTERLNDMVESQHHDASTVT